MSSIQGKLEEANRYKDLGNQLFKEGAYKKAITKYGIVLAYVRGLPGSKRDLEGIATMANTIHTGNSVSEEEDGQSLEIEKVVYQNMANCHIKLKNLQKALDYCNRAIKLDEYAWKAYFRKGEAFLLMNDFDNSRSCFIEARNKVSVVMKDDDVSLSNALNSIEREIRKCTNLEKKYDKLHKDKYTNLFEKARELDVDESTK